MSKRQINCELFIQADPKRVFEAFTDAQQLMRWFAPYVTSQPGPDGFINLRWDESNSSRDGEIIEWQPGKRLVMNWYAGPGGDHCLPVAVDFIDRDGGTLLRLVHSGFLSDESWDDEFDSHSRGWAYELRSLKYYLEEQFGRVRHFVMKRVPVAGDFGEVFAELAGEHGVFQYSPSGAARATRPVGELRLPDGQRSPAEVLYQFAGTDLVLIADILDGGLFRFALETFSGQPELWIWAFSWQLAEDELRTLTAPWFDQLEQRLNAQRSVSRAGLS